MTPYYHAGLSQPSLFFKKTLFMLSIFARPRPLNRFILGCHMIVTRSYVRKLEFCNLIGAFTFQYAAILLDQEILRKSPDPFPGGRGLGTGPRPSRDSLLVRGVGQASRASIIAESAQRRQYVFPLTRFAAWYRVSADFANLSKFSSCS